ncbi:MAG TPA: hypothetical protein VE972_11085 [Conexibacter sp.]|nr:hypothetical protein [Conexibacter sp.]
MSRTHLVALLAAGVALACSAPALGAATWRLEQPPQPAGMPFPVPLGAPGDLKLLSPSRGLLTASGNAVEPQGVYTWDGRTWRPYMTVCGGTDVSARIAIAGPSDFWVVADPAPELRAQENGTTLCHVRDGAIVASYAARPDGPDPYTQMNAAACASPSACWFGGVALDGSAGRRGAFHLRWDGTQLTSALNPQGRGVSDVEAFDGELWESSYAGAADESTLAPTLLTPEPQPLLLGRLLPGGFAPDPFAVPPGTELLALDTGGDALWAAGGGAASGPGVPPETGIVPTGPLLLRRHDGAWAQVPVASGDGTPFSSEDRFVDVAAVPGTSTAWVAVERFSDRRDAYGPARVALIDADGNVLGDDTLPADGAPRGTAARIDCAAAGECWLATYGGWLFHLTDGTPPSRDTNPAFAGTLTARPDDARTPQRILDTLPEDTSQLFAPPPDQGDPPRRRHRRRLPALIAKVTARVHGRHELVLSFRLRRRAKVGLVGTRRRRTVARARPRTLRPGRRSIALRVDPAHWPMRLRFTTKELGR